MPERNYRLQLLAPSAAKTDGFSALIVGDTYRYDSYLAKMQRMRGRIYLTEGAIQDSQLDAEGRHRMTGDERSWHSLLVDPADQVIACARYLVHPPVVSFRNTRASHSVLAKDSYWGPRLWGAIENDITLARRLGVAYVEVGGWAVAAEYRSTKAALETLLGAFAWGELIGGCICSCTATSRNRSSTVLRKVGGTSLMLDGEQLPSYFDPEYGCEMEVLRFVAGEAATRFRPLIQGMKKELQHSPILRATDDKFRVAFDLLSQAALAQSTSKLSSASSR
jgi:hypothetical protein